MFEYAAKYREVLRDIGSIGVISMLREEVLTVLSDIEVVNV